MPESMVVALTPNDGPSAVQLLEQHNTRHLVVQHALGQAQHSVGAVAHISMVAMRTSNAEYSICCTDVTYIPRSRVQGVCACPFSHALQLCVGGGQ